jgi:ferritin-like metal-binding protein YciE
MAEPNARDAKLIQYLNEAYGKEKQLETALQAHIGMTTRAPYRKRLQDHLRETKAHARGVERRIKALGGTAEPVSLPGPDAVTTAATRVTEVAQRAAALAQGPLHAVRGTGEAEKLLKNAKTEYQDEAEEIATYIGIETLAESVGDRETAQLARGIRREEERMANFLSRLIPTLTKAVAQEEIPAAERRRDGARRRRRTTRRGGTAGRASTSRGSGGSTRATGTRSSGGRSGSARSSASRTSSGRSGASRSGGSRSGTSRSGSTRSGGTRSGGTRSGASRSASSRGGGTRASASGSSGGTRSGATRSGTTRSSSSRGGGTRSAASRSAGKRSAGRSGTKGSRSGR